uniref:NADH dehydrogenase subunit 6 n=1 Tax=Moniliformis sp. TaxID=3068474 RepID=A0AA96ZS31_9BILA|nr:NADH dehydrogenase subunit 6 [Moniliformis sp.]
MVEMVLVLALSTVKLMNMVPMFGAFLLMIVVVVVMVVSCVVSSWVVYLLGVVYIGGVVVLLVYLGALNLFEVKVGVSWLFFIVLGFGMVVSGVDYVWISSVDAWGGFLMWYNGWVYLVVVMLMLFVMVLLSGLLKSVGGTLRLF